MEHTQPDPTLLRSNMRRLLFPLVLVLVLVVVRGSVEEKKPNILLIVADDLGWGDVPWRDPTVPAPNLQQLASTGLLLNQSYVQQVCTPSRAALLTGRYAWTMARSTVSETHGLHLGEQAARSHRAVPADGPLHRVPAAAGAPPGASPSTCYGYRLYIHLNRPGPKGSFH